MQKSQCRVCSDVANVPSALVISIFASNSTRPVQYFGLILIGADCLCPRPIAIDMVMFCGGRCAFCTSDTILNSAVSLIGPVSIIVPLGYLSWSVVSQILSKGVALLRDCTHPHRLTCHITSHQISHGHYEK